MNPTTNSDGKRDEKAQPDIEKGGQPRQGEQDGKTGSPQVEIETKVEIEPKKEEQPAPTSR